MKQVIVDYHKTLGLIKQRNGCRRCGISFGEHGSGSKDKFHPSCPRRKGKGDRFTTYCYQSNKEKLKGIQVRC